jgi:hypothetical protein
MDELYSPQFKLEIERQMRAISTCWPNGVGAAAILDEYDRVPVISIPAHSEAANDAALRGAGLYDFAALSLEPYRHRPVNVSQDGLGAGHETQNGPRRLASYARLSGTADHANPYDCLSVLVNRDLTRKLRLR